MRLRPMVSVVLVALLGLLAWSFLMPRAWLEALHLYRNFFARAIFCAIVAIAVVRSFALPGPARKLGRRILAVTLGLVFFVGILEIGRLLLGRANELFEFTLNATSVSLAALMLFWCELYFLPGLARDAASRAEYRRASWSAGRSAHPAPDEFPPPAYIIGAQKAASTSFAAMLGQHQDVVISDPKEPNFFTSQRYRGLDWYSTCFERLRGVLIDASTSYSMAPVGQGRGRTREDRDAAGVPKRIHEVRPDAKFIYLVRDPAARTISAYWHEVRARRERRTLREAIADTPYYLDPGYYHAQLREYLEYFDLRQFHIVRFNDFIRDPIGALDGCAGFLGLAPLKFQLVDARNESFQYTLFGKLARDVIGDTGLEEISILLRDYTPLSVQNSLKRLVAKPNPVVGAEVRQWLSSFFEKDMEAFVKLTGVAPPLELRSMPEAAELAEAAVPNP
jgi:hypothetical protein